MDVCRQEHTQRVRQRKIFEHSGRCVIGRRGGVNAQAAFGEGSPQFILVGAPGQHLVGLNYRVTRFHKRRIRRGELHAIGDQLQDEFIASGEAVLDDEFGPGFPKH